MSRVLSVFFVALLVRVVYFYFFISPEQLTVDDQILYIQLAQLLPETGINGMTTERMPGYPVFLYIIESLFGEGQWVVIAVQAVVDSMTCVIIGLLVETFLLKGFMLGGMISAFNLNMVIISGMVLTDTIFLFVFSLFLLFFVKYIQKPQNAKLFLSIFLLAIATMIRPVSYYLIYILLVCLLVWWFWKRESITRIGASVTIYLVSFMLVLGGIYHRNYTQYNTLSLVSQGGTHLLNWVVPATYQYSGLGSYQQGLEFAKLHQKRAMMRDQLDELPIDLFENSKYQIKVAKEAFMEIGLFNMMSAWTVGATINLFAPSLAYAPVVRSMDHPSFYETPGNGVIDKLWNYVNDTSGLLYLLILVLGTMSSLVFMALALFGLVKLFVRQYSDNYNTVNTDMGILIFMFLFIGYFLAITGTIIGVKYRLPIEPIMTIFVVYAVSVIFERYDLFKWKLGDKY